MSAVANGTVTLPSASRDGKSTPVSDTPRSIRHLAKGNIPGQRTLCAKEMSGEIVEVSHSTFFSTYAPFNPSPDVQVCLDALAKAKLITESRDRFVDCDVKPSTKFTREVAYEFLSQICAAISKAKVEGRKASCILEQKPDHVTESEIPGASHRVDGYFKPLKSTVPTDVMPKNTPTADNIANCEWKLRSTPKELVDNRRKIVSGAVHIMNNDVRRLFTYSITIEDESMTLWYWSRSHSAKSKPFDFTADVSTTVRAFASFIFASMEELGYDKSVQRRLDTAQANPQLCLVFRVQDRYFKTLRTMSEHLGICITGRSTRVFEVVEVKGFDDLTTLGKKTKILKDVWLDADAQTERQIQDAILQDLDTLSDKLISDGSLNSEHFHDVSEEEKKLVCDALHDRTYRDHFLTIDCDERGAQCKAIASDAVPAPGVFSPSLAVPFTVPASLSRADRSRSAQVPDGRSGSPRALCEEDTLGPPRSYVPKRQYRVVYNEVCQALHDVVDLKTVLQAMLDCLLVIQLLFLIGWVHRDISSGNLLWYSTAEGGRGILSDLEYAKKFNPDGEGSSDPKTGTPYFMAVEIQHQVYFNTTQSHQKRSIRDVRSGPTQNIGRKTNYQVIHNYEHDIESFFWLLLWTITARIDSEDLQAFAKPIFDHGPGHKSSRERILKSMGTASPQQLPELLPSSISIVAEYVDIFAHNLFLAYLDRGRNIGGLATYSTIYGSAREVLNACLDVADGPDVPPLILCFARQDMQSDQAGLPVPEARKRRLSQTEFDARLPALHCISAFFEPAVREHIAPCGLETSVSPLSVSLCLASASYPWAVAFPPYYSPSTSRTRLDLASLNHTLSPPRLNNGCAANKSTPVRLRTRRLFSLAPFIIPRRRWRSALYLSPMSRPCIKSYGSTPWSLTVSVGVSSYAGRLGALALLLFFASVSSIGIATYLLITSPETRPRNAAMDGSLMPEHGGLVVDVALSNHESLEFRSNERYLSYLPHSGFHNQRIAFENALILSRLLNRTLLVPPVRLGNMPIQYMAFDMLYPSLAVSGKEGLMHCSQLSTQLALPDECSTHLNFTHVSWRWLANLTSIEAEQRLLYQKDLTYPWLNGSSEGDIYVLKGTDPYSFRFVDYPIPPPKPGLRKYATMVAISELAASKAPLIQVGSLFGSSRLHLRHRPHRALRKRVREQMAFSNPLLQDIARVAASALGEVYLGAHIRVGDGHFKLLGEHNARLVWYKLLTRRLGLTLEEAFVLEQQIIPSAETEPPVLSQDRAAKWSYEVPPLQLFRAKLVCPRPLHTAPDLLRFNIPLFISTDAPEPHTDPLLALFHLTFPCTFFLSDILSSKIPVPANAVRWPGVAELAHLVSSYDGVPLKPFLLPFMDAVIVAHAWGVAGTDMSTFSGFVEDVLWRKYHGWDIVQRG
ncbi:hypothetical protein EVG20_g8164 [Dentipellis fragilis]|uniref:Fungal-type protein kinase domain-containing protein n=1 Tax=Dentipellis fragilis TaxID=205917 RepID=A0A4Y9Y7B8_9AGAM|nr:hypothetical protein EVG20_g8164 [Dentipellis fragilis]